MSPKRDAIFRDLAGGALSAAAFRADAGRLAGDTSDRILYDTDTGCPCFDAEADGTAVRVHFATRPANLALSAEDFPGV